VAPAIGGSKIDGGPSDLTLHVTVGTQFCTCRRQARSGQRASWAGWMFLHFSKTIRIWRLSGWKCQEGRQTVF